MTPDQQRICIAEACGWTCTEDGYWHHPDLEMRKRLNLVAGCCPDYPNDLNAMNEAEKTLSHEQLLQYQRNLCNAVGGGHYAIHATASQRAEAFIRTIGQWVD